MTRTRCASTPKGLSPLESAAAVTELRELLHAKDVLLALALARR